MKKRILCILMLAVLLVTTCVGTSLTALAASNEGLAFDSTYRYQGARSFDRTPTTFEAWINLPTSAAADRAGVILGNYGQSQPNISFEIHPNGRPRLYWDDFSGVTNWIFTDVNVCTGEWLHLTITRDEVNNEVRCYINGDLVGTLPISADTRDMLCTDPFVLGGDQREGNGMYFKGRIRSVAAYADVCSANEIKADMISPEKDDDLIAYYELSDVTSDGSIADRSGNGYNITRYKPVLWVSKEEKVPVTDFDYTFAVVGETQVLAQKHQDRFHLVYDWILDNKQSKNIQFVMGLGDVTETSVDQEWQLAMQNISRMDGVIPYSLVRGNHDAIYEFNKYYPYATYGSTVDGTYDGNMLNTWQELVVGNRKYLIFGLDYGASDAVLNWAGGVIEDHPEHNVIITTHAYLFRDGSTLDQGDVCPPATNGGYNNGDHMWNKLMSKHENIVLVLSGHDPCSRIVTAQTKGVNGNVVTQMLIDPQGADAQLGGLGMVALFHFSEDSDEIEIEYYSTFQQKYFKPDNQFTVTLDFVGEDPIDETNVPAAPSLEFNSAFHVELKAVAGMEYKMNNGEWQTSPVFNGLEPNTEYKFYQRVAKVGTAPVSATSPALTVTTDKMVGENAEAPIEVEKTHNSVTLAAVDGVEYKMNDGAWQSSPVFTGLTPNTTYTFYARYAETDEYHAGAVSEGTEVTTDADPNAPVIEPGWKLNAVGWWYLNADGSYPASAWAYIDNVWYYFNEAGYMVTGWQYIGGAWYYFNGGGAMMTGWVNDGGTWYYMNSGGAMMTGWVLDGNTWYYMNASGAMQTGWVNDGGTWYYMNAGGAMQTGWLLLGDTWYYLNASGAMVTGTAVIEGVTQRFTASGAWIA